MEDLSLMVGFFCGVMFVFFLFSFRQWYESKEERKQQKIEKQIKKYELLKQQPFTDRGTSFFGGLFKKATPIYYDAHGNIIKPPPQPQPPQPPQYNFMADTTPTIKSKNNFPEQQEHQPITNISVNGWCSKCKQKRFMNNQQIIEFPTNKGIKRFARGTCQVCNTKMNTAIG